MNNEQLKERVSPLPTKQRLLKENNISQRMFSKISFTNLLNLSKNLMKPVSIIYSVYQVWIGEIAWVLYIFWNPQKHRHALMLKTKTSNRKEPVLVSVSDLWKTADFLEREVFDLFGITFKNHPDMRRIFLDESWEGYPLRKDYVDELNIIER